MTKEDAYSYAYRLASEGASFNAIRVLFRQTYPKAALSQLTFRNLHDGYEDANAKIVRLPL